MAGVLTVNQHFTWFTCFKTTFLCYDCHKHVRIICQKDFFCLFGYYPKSDSKDHMLNAT